MGQPLNSGVAGLELGSIERKEEKQQVIRGMIEIVTHIAAFILGVVATILSKMFWWLFKTGQIKKAVKLALNDFTTLWDAFLKEKTPNIRTFSRRDIMPILSGVPDIRKLIMSKPERLANPHLKDALAIADEINLIIEQLKSPMDSKYGERSVGRKEIDVLAKRARQCSAKLEGGNRTK